MEHGEGVVKLCDVVNAVEIGAVLGGEEAHDGSGEGGGFGQGGVCQDFPEESFAGECHEEGAMGYAQRFQMANEGEVVGGCFAETDAGVQADAGGCNAGLLCQGESLFKEGAHLGYDIVVMRGNLHGLRGALHVHEDDAAGLSCTQGPHFSRGQAGDIINDVGPGGKCSSCDRGVACVDGKECGGKFSAQGSNDGGGAVLFFLR